MSWQDYVDKQLLASRCITKAAIAGLDGNVWAKSDNFDVSSRFEAGLRVSYYVKYFSVLEIISHVCRLIFVER